MPGLATDHVWRERLARIDNQVEDIELPDADATIDQDEEWCEALIEGERRRIRFHDYSEVFDIPGLYEELFYEKLECCSPSYIANLLESVMEEHDDSPGSLRLLDLGAGNGMVGDELQRLSVDSITGVDIISAAKAATLRDRPGVYDDYHVCDLTDVAEQTEEKIRSARPNCLTSVAALGFGDIPPAAFLKALDLVERRGWIAINIKEDFLQEDDNSGFCRLVRRLSRERVIQPHAYRRYKHRLSISGRPLYYVAMISRKLRDVPDTLLGEVLDGEDLQTT